MLFRALNVIAALLMFVGVGLQYNDPDAIAWMAVYGVAGMLAALAVVVPGEYPWTLPGLVGLVALVWAVIIAPQWVGQVPLGRLFSELDMSGEKVELARETIGLAMVAAWMAFLVTARLMARGQASGGVSATDISR